MGWGCNPNQFIPAQLTHLLVSTVAWGCQHISMHWPNSPLQEWHRSASSYFWHPKDSKGLAQGFVLAWSGFRIPLWVWRLWAEGWKTSCNIQPHFGIWYEVADLLLASPSFDLSKLAKYYKSPVDLQWPVLEDIFFNFCYVYYLWHFSMTNST